MASPIFSLYFPIFMAYSASFALSSYPNYFPPSISSISAAPEFSPSPAPAPDISPLFPTPGGAALPPADSSFPTIPSSPSPPNPDFTVSAPAPELPLPPSQSLPFSAATAAAPYSGGWCRPVMVVLTAALAAELGRRFRMRNCHPIQSNWDAPYLTCHLLGRSNMKLRILGVVNTPSFVCASGEAVVEAKPIVTPRASSYPAYSSFTDPATIYSLRPLDQSSLDSLVLA